MNTITSTLFLFIKTLPGDVVGETQRFYVSVRDQTCPGDIQRPIALPGALLCALLPSVAGFEKRVLLLDSIMAIT